MDRILTVRSAALAQFGEDAIPMGRPLAEIEDTLVPLYLLHRYQTEAAAKEVGGLNYRYALRGDGQLITQIVDPGTQRKALAALLKTISPATLTLPESLLQILPPRPPGYPRTRESFSAQTGVTFDPQGAADAATEITLGLLFDPQRASRLVEYNARNANNPTLHEVIEAIITATWKAPQIKGLQGQVQRATAGGGCRASARPRGKPGSRHRRSRRRPRRSGLPAEVHRGSVADFVRAAAACKPQLWRASICS